MVLLLNTRNHYDIYQQFLTLFPAVPAWLGTDTVQGASYDLKSPKWVRIHLSERLPLHLCLRIEWLACLSSPRRTDGTPRAYIRLLFRFTFIIQMQTLMAIWNNGILLFSNRLSTYEGLIWVCCVCCASPFKSASPLCPPQPLPSQLDKTHPTGPDTYRFLPPGRATWTSATAISKEAELLFQFMIAPSRSCCWCWSLRTQTCATFPIQTDWNSNLLCRHLGKVRGHDCYISYPIFHVRKKCWNNCRALTDQRNNILPVQKTAPFSFSIIIFFCLRMETQMTKTGYLSWECPDEKLPMQN